MSEKILHILRIFYGLFTDFIKLIMYSYINIFKNMFKIHREIVPPVAQDSVYTVSPDLNYWI